jgi:hypothetical protein
VTEPKTFLRQIRVEWLWAAYGVVGIFFGVELFAHLGSSLAETRTILGAWLLITAGFAAWRWWIAADRAPLLLIAALLALSLALIVWFGGVLALDAIKAAVGAFWISVGALELAAWTARARGSLQSPWISLGALIAGVVTITFPSALVVHFTLVAAIWALVLGLACVVRAGWLLVEARRPISKPASRLLRGVSVAVPAILLVAPLLAYGSIMAGTRAADGRQAELDPFYEVPLDLAPGDPGSIIRATGVDLQGLHGVAWRVLFRSEDEHDRPTVSAGLIFAPSGGGSDRPVVAWAHGTVGLGRQCAPSRDSAALSHIPWVNDMLDRGWVVTAPDYAGAGGTGVGEKYLVIAEQGRDLVNAVRAARGVPGTGAGDRFATYGESQGGLIALAGGALAPTYAPELHPVGIGGVASASDAGAAIQHSWDRPLPGWLLGPSLVRAWVRQYPSLDAGAVLSDAGREHYAEIADNGCIFDVLGFLVNPQMGTFFGKDPTSDPAWRAAFIANKAPLPPVGVPVFIGHGMADPLIDPGYSVRAVQRYCDAGAAVATHWMSGVGHIASSTDAAPAYVTWLSGLLAGGSAPSNCGEAPPVPAADELK